MLASYSRNGVEADDLLRRGKNSELHQIGNDLIRLSIQQPCEFLDCGMFRHDKLNRRHGRRWLRLLLEFQNIDQVFATVRQQITAFRIILFPKKIQADR